MTIVTIVNPAVKDVIVLTASHIQAGPVLSQGGVILADTSLDVIIDINSNPTQQGQKDKYLKNVRIGGFMGLKQMFKLPS